MAEPQCQKQRLKQHLTSPGHGWDSRLHVPGASPRQGVGRPHRLVLLRGGAVRDGDRGVAFPWGKHGGDFQCHLEAGTRSPVAVESRLPVEYEQIINKALEKDRKLRYQHASDMRTDLNDLKRDSGGRVQKQWTQGAANDSVQRAPMQLAIQASDIEPL